MKRKEKKRKKKVCQVENPKGWPRQKLSKKDPARLKTQKGGLDQRQGKEHGHGENSFKDVMGKNYMAWKKEKKKRRKIIKTISQDNK